MPSCLPTEDIKTKMGWTPLHIAAFHGQVPLCFFFLPSWTTWEAVEGGLHQPHAPVHCRCECKGHDDFRSLAELMEKVEEVQILKLHWRSSHTYMIYMICIYIYIYTYMGLFDLAGLMVEENWEWLLPLDSTTGLTLLRKELQGHFL